MKSLTFYRFQLRTAIFICALCERGATWRDLNIPRRKANYNQQLRFTNFGIVK
jgi:hypothetical protein